MLFSIAKTVKHAEIQQQCHATKSRSACFNIFGGSGLDPHTILNLNVIYFPIYENTKIK